MRSSSLCGRARSASLLSFHESHLLKKIPTALIGYGHIGRWHAQKIDEHKSADLTAVVEINPKTYPEIKEKYPGVFLTAHLEEAMDKAQAFIVATPTATHASVVTALLKQGKHILCEKPLTAAYGEALSIMEEKKKRDTILQVGHSERYHPIWDDEKPYVRFLTPPSLIRANRLGIFKGRAVDVDVVCDLMIHDLDLIYYLSHDTPETVRAVGHKVKTQKWDHVMVTMTLRSGSQAVFTAGRNYVEEVRNLEFFNKSGCFFVDLYRREVKVLDNKEGLSFSSYEKRDHLLAEQDHFYRSILGKEKSRAFVDDRDGAFMVRVIDKILESLETGEAVGL